MNHIKITCPACSGHGKFRVLNTKCSYCNGGKLVKLTYHLRKIGHLRELKNVEDFQRRSETKIHTHEDN